MVTSGSQPKRTCNVSLNRKLFKEQIEYDGTKFKLRNKTAEKLLVTSSLTGT
jgi:hypothetical protein